MIQKFACPLGKCLPWCADSVNLRGFTLFNVDFERRKYPSARCTPAANTMSRDICMSVERRFCLRPC
jgi:hypothetical protein